MAAGTLLLYGCARPRVDVPSIPVGDRIAVQAGRVGYVVAAPPGRRDVGTDEMATEIARRTGFGLVLASGSTPTPSGATGVGRDAAARPLEGAPLPEPVDPAREAGERYADSVRQAARGPLRFVAEIHGDARAACAGRLEIATVGVDPELALRLRALAELIRDAHLRNNGEIAKLDVLVEPVDRTPGAARDGVMRLPERAMHIEIPGCGRRDWREAYTAILADFLTQAVTLPVGR